ncbi:MAG: hydroxymethylglutaryl-CoA reductase, degradative [Bdellovibrionales bacterium]|nr:hydroxymethylglutaryl-CoA reductase, degradative [Bdellovibrionales bacterium]
MDRLDGLMSGFHKLTREERLERLQRASGLSAGEIDILSGRAPADPAVAEHLIENAVGYFPMPLGVATHFRVDGRDLLIPMAVEETSIIAAASATAKWIRASGSITTWMRGRIIIGQVQLPSVKDVARARRILDEHRDALMALANACVPGLVDRGGGVRDLSVRELPRPESDSGRMLVLHVHCDPVDAMGANLINQVCEALKPAIEDLTGERVGLCILSNLMDGRLAGVEVVVRNVDPTVGRGIEEAWRFAEADPYRACTHNKGILNGVDAVLLATGNDWRAVEAGAHAFAARSGRYAPLSEWRMKGADLVGRMEMPLAVGTVGGVTRVHPTARVCLKLLGAERGDDLARVCAAVGLVQNLGALRALATVGIVRGHMQLHAANLAIAAGAEGPEVARVRDRLVGVLRDEKRITLGQAQAILRSIRVADDAGGTQYA